jgi:anti-sigma B factor antagonist
MSTPPQSRLLEATVRYMPDLAIIDLSGEINAFAETTINSAYQEAEESDPKAILLNFSAVDYINSTGIALIVGILAQTRKTHRRIITFGLSDHYREIFNITRLSDFMDVFLDELSALASIDSRQG